MYLSNRDIKWAVERGLLIVDPPPDHYGGGYDENSIDLHLDVIEEAKVWDIRRWTAQQQVGGHGPDLNIGTFQHRPFSEQWTVRPPKATASQQPDLVLERDGSIVIKPGGFMLWQTAEWVENPAPDSQFIAFVNAKSTKARTGIIVHLTAPTIHACWGGHITLEIANMGPFHLVISPRDAIAQLTVARITSSPDLSLKRSASQTQGQTSVHGAPGPRRRRRSR